jgi:hypothetical protein
LFVDRYGEHFGHLLLVIDLSAAPDGCVADISMCSKFEEEGEVLLLPWLLFEVTAVRAFDEEEQKNWQAVQAVHLGCLGWRFDGLVNEVVGGATGPHSRGWLRRLLHCTVS